MANHGYADLMETPLDDITGRTIREIAGDEAYALAEPYIRRALAGEATTYERRRPRKDGSARDLRIDNVPHLDESGHVTGACALIIDITALKESQQALCKSEARFRGLADLWADWYWEQDESLPLYVPVDRPGAQRRPFDQSRARQDALGTADDRGHRSTVGDAPRGA
jgi:PAS domain S-box-containing protein